MLIDLDDLDAIRAELLDLEIMILERLRDRLKTSARLKSEHADDDHRDGQ